MKHLFFAILTALTIGPAVSAQSAQTPDTLAAMFTDAGYRFETTESGFRWLIHADGTRVSFTEYSHPDHPGVWSIRLSAMFLVWDSSAALDGAHNFERTNALASVARLDMEDGAILMLQRDIVFLSERTPENILGSASLLFQQIPVFQQAIEQSDPELARRWSGQ